MKKTNLRLRASIIKGIKERVFKQTGLYPNFEVMTQIFDLKEQGQFLTDINFGVFEFDGFKTIVVKIKGV